MVYRKPALGLFYKILFATALLILLLALLFLPRESFRLIKTSLVFSQNWPALIKSGRLAALISEFQEANPHIVIELRNGNADITGYDMPSGPGWEKENACTESREIAAFANVLYYNIDALEARGFDRPPKTREELVNMVNNIAETEQKESQKRKGILFSNNFFESITPWFWAAGIKTNPLDASGVIQVHWDSRRAVDTFAFLKTLYDGKNIGQDPLSELSPTEITRAFSKGECVFFIGASSEIARIKEESPKMRFSVTAIPAPASYTGKPVSNVLSWKVGVSNDSGHKDAALLFVTFMESKRDEIAAALGAIPGNPAGILSNEPADEVSAKIRSIYEASDIVRDAALYHDPLRVSSALEVELKKMYENEQTPRQTAEAVAAELGGAE
jgi:ABC-type glycerol-3-phosphate transport system substrate-binding protein